MMPSSFVSAVLEDGGGKNRSVAGLHNGNRDGEREEDEYGSTFFIASEDNKYDAAVRTTDMSLPIEYKDDVQNNGKLGTGGSLKPTDAMDGDGTGTVIGDADADADVEADFVVDADADSDADLDMGAGTGSGVETDAGFAVPPNGEDDTENALVPEIAIITENTISGSVWLDENEDGVWDVGEQGIAGLSVSLFSAQDMQTAVTTVVTDSAGEYGFENLAPEAYRVGVQAQTIDGNEYLVPMRPPQTGEDNHFDVDWRLGTDFDSDAYPVSYHGLDIDSASSPIPDSDPYTVSDSDPIYSFTDPITMSDGSYIDITGINAAMRGEPQLMPMEAGTIYVSGGLTNTYTTLASALSDINSSTQTTFVIELDNFSESRTTVLNIGANKDITIKSINGPPSTYKMTGPARHFSLGAASKLTLEDVILEGIHSAGNTTICGGIAVSASGAELILEPGAVIQNCYNTAGGGVIVSNGGKVTMNGGSITGNGAGDGGGIYAAAVQATIIINGGDISNNTAIFISYTYRGSGGGICVYADPLKTNEVFKITLYGGTISGNTAAEGGGIRCAYSAPEILEIYSGCTISGNTATSIGGGILAHRSTSIMMYGGSIENNTAGSTSVEGYGGGVLVESFAADFTMMGGTIKNNKAHNGGGVGVQYGDFSMTGGKITGNEAIKYAGLGGQGGGVCVLYSGEFLMTDGEITTNKADGGIGGGVALDDNDISVPFTMAGGLISGNSALSGGGVGGIKDFALQSGSITGNTGVCGGGVYLTSGKLTMTGGSINNNVATGSVYTEGGGGVFLFNTAQLELSNGIITENKATGGNGGGVAVFSVSSAGAFSMSGGKIEDNLANNGGGLFVQGNIRLSPELMPGPSPGLAPDGSGVADGVVDAELTGGTIEDNSAGSSGGGIYISPDTVFAMSGGLVTLNDAVDGGGVYVDEGTFMLQGGTISINSAGSGGGVCAMSGIFEMIDGLIDENTALLAGGGVILYGSCEFTMEGGSISNNLAGGNSAFGYGYGGGVCLFAMWPLTPEFYMGGGSINNNHAYNGGGVSLLDGFFSMNGGEITDNAASPHDSGGGDGGGICISNEAKFLMTAGEIMGNKADNGVGGGVGLNFYENFIVGFFSFTMEGGTIHDNSALQGGGVGGYGHIFIDDGIITLNTAVNGAGVYLEEGTLTMDGGSIHHNEATGTGADEGGGGVFLFSVGRLHMLDGEIHNNEALNGNGGGVAVYGNLETPALLMEGGEIYENTALNGGGAWINGTPRLSPGFAPLMSGGFDSPSPAAYLIDPNALMSGGTIYDNSAVDGGGVYICEMNFFAMPGGLITVNSASDEGGGVYVTTNANFILDGGTIDDNKAVNNGGGVAVFSGNITKMTDGLISNNSATGATGYGGGIYLYASEFAIEGGVVSGNAAVHGGGVYLYSGLLTMTNTGAVTGNESSLEGGGIFTRDYDYNSPASIAKYSNISIASTATVSGNKANTFERMPSNAASFTARATRSFNGTLLNNYQINYINPNYSVIYKANNGTSEPDYYQYVDVTSGPTNIITTTIATAGFTGQVPNTRFLGWNTLADGTGIMHSANETVTITGTTTYYAIWGPGGFDLTVTKTVTGAFADLTKGYTFTIQFQNSLGTALAAGTEFTFTGGIITGSGATAPVDGMLTLDSGGAAAFTLYHGQVIKIKEVFSDYKISIVETTDALYSTSFKDSMDLLATAGANTGVRSMTADNRQFDFINARSTVTPTGIRLSKGEVLLPGVLALCSAAGWITVPALYRRRKKRSVK